MFARCSLLFTLALALGFAAPTGRATQTDNHGIHATPAPGKVTVDGKLDDWDLSGATLMCYDLESLQDVYSAKVAMMYDAEALYVAIQWRDPVPMGNRHDPHFQANKGWAGDAVQLRIMTDRISHVTAWYYGVKQEPFINIAYGEGLGKAFGGGSADLFQTKGWELDGGAAMGFVADADGKGYVQEMRLPWALITTAKAYKAGEQFSCGVELLWGEADWPVHRYADNLAEGTTSREFFWTALKNWGPVILEPTGKLTLPTPAWEKAMAGEALQGPVEVAYELPKDAKVTLAIDDAAGNRVRNLISALPRSAGKNVERWDGLNDAGEAVAPGEYTVKGLYHDGIHVSYLMSFANPGNPTWDTADGKGAFYSDHVAPSAVAAAGDYVALGADMGEAGRHLIGLTIDGQRLWGLADREFATNRAISLATDGKLLWIANESKSKAFIYRVEMATGKYAPWERKAIDKEGREHQPLELPVTETIEGNLKGIAVHGNTLAVCFAKENLVKLYDATTGEVLKSLAVTGPTDVAFDPTDGEMLVLAAGKLLRLRADGSTDAFNRGEWADAYGLTIGPDRKVYLSVRGAAQNVLVFDADGKPVGSIGAAGGRPAYGAYDPAGMREPAALAIDSRGRLWVPETTQNPKRTSVWNTATGKLDREFVGTTHYAASGAINPMDPTMAFSDSTVYKIDLATGAWQPTYSLGARDDANDLFPPYADSHMRFMQHDGATYVYATDTARESRATHVMRFDGTDWTSVAHVGVVPSAKEKPTTGSSITATQQKVAAEYEKYAHPVFDGHDGQPYAWADANGDGLVQAAEMRFGSADQAPLSCYWGTLPTTDGTLVYMTPDTKALATYPITGWSASGAPIYDVSAPKVVTLQGDAGPATLSGEGMLVGGSQGRMYLNRSPLTSVGPDGRVLGTYPSPVVSVHGSHRASAAKPGYLIGPSSVLGVADFGGELGEVFNLNGNLGQNYLFTADCLWIQSLFKDTRGWFESPAQAVRGMPMDGTTAGGESFGGFFTRTASGQVLLLIGGTDARVLEVTGLDTVRRFSGAFTYTPAEYAEAQLINQERQALANQPKAYTVPRVANADAIAIDGALDKSEWPEFANDELTALDIQESPSKRYGRVAARYDASSLYLAWFVRGPDHLRNAGQDERLLFKTGDCVDLMLGPADAKKNVGNLRLLISAMDRQPVVVLYEKAVPGTADADREKFSSPWRTITFDRVSRRDDVRVATAATKGGYIVEAAVPWTVLGITPAAGLKLRGDVGILFGDNGGTLTVSRQYWCNKATNLVNDIPGEADLVPAAWGDWTLE